MTTSTAPKENETSTAEAIQQPSFITPEMIEAKPVLEAAGAFAEEPYWVELMAEIKKERARQRRREARQAK
jgi:hypothetical protein